MTRILNALTVDVEEYFQVSAFDRLVPRAAWDTFESRVERSTDRILEMLAEANVRGTFFVLGWLAKRKPSLVRRIAALGHEIGSHSFKHRLVYELTPEGFRLDLRQAREAIEDACGAPVMSFRAPSFSITARSEWALDILIEEGYAYDSSIFPIRHDRYGMKGAPRHAHLMTRAAGSIWEVPPSTVRIAGATLPVAGGGYFRLFPYGWTRKAIARLNDLEHRPAIVYLHPWELDPDQPRMPVTGLTRFRHYVNLGRTEGRLEQLLADFSFGPISSVLVQQYDETRIQLAGVLAANGAHARSYRIA